MFVVGAVPNRSRNLERAHGRAEHGRTVMFRHPKGVETSHMSLSYVDSGIILRTPAGMGSVMHSQAVTLLRFVPAALVLFALAIAGVINQAPILTIVSGLMTVALTITLSMVHFFDNA